ncbi:hypothetical protein [Plantactinospora sp. B5E13]|uniref:hypothetical protein n=1 Tax=unclassified Plantactinospora TaxID=2631981 RepID=UPI00325CDB56
MIFELLAGHLSAVTDVTIVNARISGIRGTRRAPARPVSRRLDARARRAGRALALLQLTEELHHTTHNVASGRATSNAEVITAIRSVEPGFRFELPSAGARPRAWLDITRLREDTGFEPQYDTAAGAADYIAWLRAGNER